MAGRPVVNNNLKQDKLYPLHGTVYRVRSPLKTKVQELAYDGVDTALDIANGSWQISKNLYTKYPYSSSILIPPVAGGVTDALIEGNPVKGLVAGVVAGVGLVMRHWKRKTDLRTIKFD